MLSIVSWLLFLTSCKAFIAPNHQSKWSLACRPQHPPMMESCHHASSNDYNNNDAYNNNDPNDTLAARTCIRQFLTQRSIQSFLLLLKECHDPHTVSWIENFIGTNNLLSYHGTGALDLERLPFWDSVLVELMEQPMDALVVEIKKMGEGRGLSKNNPYRDAEDYTMDIEIDIDPVSLAGRILSVREKIGNEWKKDLELVQSANEHIIESYNERSLKKRIEEMKKKDVMSSHDDDDPNEEEFQPLPMDSPPSSSSSSAEGELTAAVYSGTSPENQSFDRMEIFLLNNHPSFNDMESTPLRASSFDLLFMLSTQESIHRLLKHYQMNQDENDISFEWLSDFYESNLEQYFDGDGGYGRSDDFLDLLLQKSPAIKTLQDGRFGFIDPHAIAEYIVQIRTSVLEEWQGIMSVVSTEQSDLRKIQHIRQMAKWGQHIEDDTTAFASVDDGIHIEGNGQFE